MSKKLTAAVERHDMASAYVLRKYNSYIFSNADLAEPRAGSQFLLGKEMEGMRPS